MIDLNKTWCELTMENINKLNELGVMIQETWTHLGNFIFIGNGAVSFCKTNNGVRWKEKYKQIHLVNGEFEFVKETNVGESIKEVIECCNICGYPKSECPDENKCSYKIKENKCQFAKYGFEVPDYKEAEIFTEKRDWLLGYVYDGINSIPCKWDKDTGKAFGIYDNLTPLKKEWYEDDDNIGKLCITTDTNELFFLKGGFDNNCTYATRDFKKGNRKDTNWCDVTVCRPATSEEVEKLIIKETK